MDDINKIWEVMLDDDFKKILSSDEVLDQLQKQKFNPKAEYLQLMLTLNKTLKICGLSCQVLTPAMWSFLYTIKNNFVTHEKPISNQDIDVFLYILHNGFSSIDESLFQKSKEYCIKNNLIYSEVKADIEEMIYLSFRALQMFPKITNNSNDKIRYDLDWLTKISAMVCDVTNYTSDYVYTQLSLTECFYHVVQYARKNDPKNDIRRANSDQINELIWKRTMELGQKYYQDNYEGK